MRNTTKFAAVSAFVLLVGASSIVLAESTGQYIDDATITTEVKAALLSDLNLKAMQINVVTSRGVVQLNGSVDTKDQESEAIKVANRIDGVKSVRDLMTVKGVQEQ